MDAEKQHQKHTEEETRYGDSQQRSRYRNHVNAGSPSICSQNSQGDSDNQRYKLRENSQAESWGKVFPYGIQHGGLKEIGLSPITVEHVYEPVCVLHKKGAVKPQLCI